MLGQRRTSRSLSLSQELYALPLNKARYRSSEHSASICSSFSSPAVFVTPRRVYSLDLTSGAEVEISKSPTPLFMAPSTHCVGGEDAVLVVEGDQSGGQHLVSVKADGSAKKRLCPVRAPRRVEAWRDLPCIPWSLGHSFLVRSCG